MSIQKPDGAVYAGTFDPITNGHIDVIQRAARVFGRVYVAVASGGPNATTKSTFFSNEERVLFAEKAIAETCREFPADTIIVHPFSGLLVNFVAKLGGRVIVRGLRAVSDYEYETQLAHTNRMLSPGVETVFFVTSEPNSFISSSIVRNVALNGGDISGMVPKVIVSEFEKKLAQTLLQS